MSANADTRRRVCIVTPGYLASTPRVVREADALAAAGYQVRVAFTQGALETHRVFDRELIQDKNWAASCVGWSDQRAGERWRYHVTRVRHAIARALPSGAWAIPGLVERAEGRIFPELAFIATKEPADLYIGHYPTGLAAAAAAARAHHGQLGYDVEDLYPDILPDAPEFEKEKARILTLERQYVPHCSYISAVSEPAAQAFAERFHVSKPVVVHNCHPWRDRERIDGKVLQRQGLHLSMYWFSQTVGLNRGIQDAIRAAGLMASPVQIHIQGSVDDSVKTALLIVAAECEHPPTLHFHRSVPPQELLSRASEHDIGLALETDETTNRRLSVTNKLFLYFCAGLACAATDLPGQRSVLKACPDAGFLYPSGDFRALAAGLENWSGNGDRLSRARQASLDAARHTWNWELESRRVVAEADRVLRTQSVSAA